MKFDFLKPIFINPMKNTAEIPKDSKLTVEEVIPLMDRSYHTDKNCIGCGKCSNICPVQNIKMVDDKPIWQHKCENCLACIKWCPQKAIYGYGGLPKGYHHPEVKISDMFL